MQMLNAAPGLVVLVTLAGVAVYLWSWSGSD